MIRRALGERACLLLAGGLLSIAAQAEDAARWLEKMSLALEDTAYHGVLLREQNGRSEALEIFHTKSDGVVRERLVSQEGSGFEIIRNGDEVHCVLPDKRAVLIEAWDERSTLFASLPSSTEGLVDSYDLLIQNKQRIAGRKALLMFIDPRDDLRFGHRVWLDIETGFPLKTQLVDRDGAILEQIRFADITLNAAIAPEDLQTRYDLSGFKWYPAKKERRTSVANVTWQSSQLPAGFVVESRHKESMGESDATVTHIVYSDGLSKVSVFIETAKSSSRTMRSRVGGSHSFSTVVDGYQVTAVGEVPAATVEKIALSMRLPR
ncbi:MAG: MucB/RseB C-terminal domain-containing protein [Woeseiaceae bacterium]|nr:MucB/RseB C-terminal domain-containing protein [Woeseiaceae bacterium]